MRSIRCEKLEAKISSLSDFRNLLREDLSGTVAISFINPFSYPLISANSHLVDNIDIWFVDGALLCKLTNLFRSHKVDRVSFDFSSIASSVFSHAVERDLRVALLGGTKEEAERALQYVQAEFPSLNVAYSRSGYFYEEDLPRVFNDIKSSIADIVIVGMGTPKQEEIILGLKAMIERPALLFTCGGFITQTGMAGDYYPAWVKRTGLRWAYRAVKHKYVRDRIIKKYPIFIFRYVIEGLFGRR